ncbi:MAG: DEAD/DEAH box helicase [Bacteroidales bacterium]|nr:DEAD/DEAH box helicase [Bacteroidales bacterium]MCF8454573.1 DEAD/DEAH box helicase [Bacteroidales bacterium]
MENRLELVRKEIKDLKDNKNYGLLYRKGHSLFLNGQSMLLSRSSDLFDFSIFDEFDDYKVMVDLRDGLLLTCTCKSQMICHHKIAALMQSHEEISREQHKPTKPGMQYTRKGMEKRVLQERQEKAEKAQYQIELSDNIHGEHILYNERRQKYKITLRDLKKKQGHCSCPDFQTNKLGTCKHLMFAFEVIERKPQLFKSKSEEYPFVEIYLDPLHNYEVAWYFPGRVGNPDISSLLFKHFGKSMRLPDENIVNFLGFLKEAEKFKQILIRPEVYNKVEKIYGQDMLVQISKSVTLDFSKLNVELFPYQKKGVEFATFKEGAIIADEMGLGKTLQAIAVAIMKKELFGFTRCLVICPASLKEQWKKEIEKFSSEKAIIVEGSPGEREGIYQSKKAYFIIANYEVVIRDRKIINKTAPDFIILDEAQRIKNYQTLTANAIKSLKKKHSLVITGTPIENRLTDLYSIVGFIDPEFLSPLWEFSYQHYYFDAHSKNKIMGYFDLEKLKTRMSKILIRREKSQVMDELPNISQIDVPIPMHPEQEMHHGNYARGVASILGKKFKTAFDWQTLMNLLTKMRMVCDSTFLVDLETNFSPKLDELKHILFEKLNVQEAEKKIIIFSEWKRMNGIIGKMLRDNGVVYAELNGSIPVNRRGKLIEEFEQNPECKVFISTEAGGTGLNLQVADTVINFELPWNPAKKNQRIGRIDRIGQLKKKLTVINLITRNSIEMSIAAGLMLKQNLFEGVLSPEVQLDQVNFDDKGKAQFLTELEQAITGFIEGHEEEEEIREVEVQQAEEIEINEIVAEEEPESDEAESQPESVQPEEKAEADKGNGQPSTAENIEQVMNQGMGFLSGLFKMATGKDLLGDEQSVTVNKDTGEVTFKFKIPI